MARRDPAQGTRVNWFTAKALRGNPPFQFHQLLDDRPEYAGTSVLSGTHPPPQSEAPMLILSDTELWLDDVDPWTTVEAQDLLSAVHAKSTTGLFHCSGTADGMSCYVMAAHATSVLHLAGRRAWADFIELVAARYELSNPLRARPTLRREQRNATATPAARSIRTQETA